VSSGTPEPYLLLNVLSDSDLSLLEDLCDPNDGSRKAWHDAVYKLTTTMTPYVKKQGLFVPDSGSPLTTVYGAGDLCQALDQDVPVDSYALTAVGKGAGYVVLALQDGSAFTPAGDQPALQVIRVGTNLHQGNLALVTSANPLSAFLTLEQTVDLAGQGAANFNFDWRIKPPNAGAPDGTNYLEWPAIDASKYPDGIRATLGGKADVQALSDNYVVMRYQSKTPGDITGGEWSEWTQPQLAEGWIKRVLAGVNPFDQRVTDLLNHAVNDQVSLLSQAGPRWEGNIALSQDTLNDYGLIPIYETVLNIGRNLSIDAGINYGPANDALLLASGYLSDLYSILGNEAWAEANNPTISVGTNAALGSVSTSLFPFLGETATLLEQELDQLRGRDDFEVPGVIIPPVYNRLYWNYTKGINSGEVIYALNFDIKPAPGNASGVIDAADAQYLYPQGHGDAYGHYLTAAFNYYRLLLNPNFTWVPQPEAVTVLGTPVLVNYMHERKFAQSAAAMAQSGLLVYNLTWRGEYLPGASNGWAHLGNVVANSKSRGGRTRYWGSDQWASRVAVGSYLNWVVGNSLIPPVDPDPLDQGIQKVDRTTVAELEQLPGYGTALQTAMDNAEGHLNPLGLPENAVAFDINPNQVTGANPQTHFEQVYARAVGALDNAVYAFNQAQDVTSALRNQQDSLSDYVSQVNQQELAYTNQLIAIFGTPYSDDIGPGGTYPQNYQGPDLVHYSYVDQTDLPNTAGGLGINGDPFKSGSTDLIVMTESLPSSYLNWLTDPSKMAEAASAQGALIKNGGTTGDIGNDLNSIGTDGFTNSNVILHLDNEGFVSKPASWVGSRTYTGTIQQAIEAYKTAWWKLAKAATDSQANAQNFQQMIGQYEAKKEALRQEFINDTAINVLKGVDDGIKAAKSIFDNYMEAVQKFQEESTDAIVTSTPSSEIVGTADGGDILAPARGAEKEVGAVAEGVTLGTKGIADAAFEIESAANSVAVDGLQLDNTVRELSADLNQSLQDIVKATTQFSDYIADIDSALRDVNAKKAAVQTAIAQGNQLLATRASYRAREAGVIQGFRTRDAAFRLFQNEKLERYNTLFNLAQQYAMLAANAYDYETGLLGSKAGRQIVRQIVGTRMLGVVDGSGNPQYAASSGGGDPGLSSVLAEMWADWSALKGRLGFNNPDGYGTVASLRSENFRIVPTSDGDLNWQDLLARSRVSDLLSDPDAARYCLQMDPGNGLPVPGIVLSFSTTIGDSVNLFGKPLAAGDHAFSKSSFATKIYAVGVALEGYPGMDAPPANGRSVGGGTPTNPTTTFNDPAGLSANPYVYLVPVGVDSMRTPALGDTTGVRTWAVNDIAIPMPFNLGDSGFSTQPVWQSSDSLQEPPFMSRKHQAFRPVPDAEYFDISIYGVTGSLQPSQFTNSRLIGRSVWNSKWKLIIPGTTLLADPNAGLDRFIQSVKDVKLYFVTYSYSGN
jgi:hypothetical protein